MDRTLGTSRPEKDAAAGGSEVREKDPTYQHTQPVFLDDTARKAPEPPIPAAEEPSPSDDAPAGPRTLGEGDFTIAFIEEEILELGLAKPDADDDSPRADADGPRTVTGSDFTIAFTPEDADRPMAAAEEPRPSSAEEVDTTAPRTATDSDYTVNFVEDEPTPPIEGGLGPAAHGNERDDGAMARAPTDSDYTVNFVEDEPTPDSPSQGNARNDLTLDSADLAKGLPSEPGTAPAAPRAATDSDYTFAFVEDRPLHELNSLATHGTGMTLDAGELPPEQMEMLTGMWESTIPPDARPGMTIKTSSAGSASQTQLVVRPRSVRAPEEPAPDGADYELLETIGKGGMGVVYAARQASIDRTVAIKMIRREMASDSDQRQKFLSEAVVTGDLDHPNIVPIYDLGSNESVLFSIR